MVRWGWRIGLPVVALFVPCCLGLWLCPLPPSAPPWRATIQELIRGETPEARVAAYVQAIVRGDEEAALAAWEVRTEEAPEGRSALLNERRQEVTRELLAAGLDPDYTILGIEWWSTCCEPGVTDDPRNAGGARITVQFLGQDGWPLLYLFDVFNRGGSYWGAAAGYPPRSWALYDVYPQGDEPLFWRWVYEPTVRCLDCPPTTTPGPE
jgi:hypothetical protein